MNCSCGTDTNDIFYVIIIKKFVGIDSYGRHAHSAGHNGYTLAFIIAGVTLNSADIINKHSIIQISFCNELCPLGIAGHKNGFSKIACFCRNMRGRNVVHMN
ncbi:unknown [Clostridium sp. CAG:138]|nr:unknown [Clostridium sp. CAG:138]